MKCLSPMLIRRKDGPKRSALGHHDFFFELVPCGKCPACLSLKRSQWLFRLEQHALAQVAPNYFVTLTYNDYFLPRKIGQFISDGKIYPSYTSLFEVDIGIDKDFDSLSLLYMPGSVRKSDVQGYVKRLRNYSDTNLTYYCVSEYGPHGSRRPHYHLLIFNYSGPIDKLVECWSYRDNSTSEPIPLGHVKVGDVNSASINYCAAYIITKQDNPQYTVENFSLISNGISKDFCTLAQKKRLQEYRYVYTSDGIQVPTPRYIADKLHIPSPTMDERFVFSHDANRRLYELCLDLGRGDLKLGIDSLNKRNDLKSLIQSDRLGQMQTI